MIENFRDMDLDNDHVSNLVVGSESDVDDKVDATLTRRFIMKTALVSYDKDAKRLGVALLYRFGSRERARNRRVEIKVYSEVAQ